MVEGQSFIEVYTDGACSRNPGPAGIGVVLSYKDHTKEISRYIGHATNNIAELRAILDALKAIRSVDKQIIIYTDSTYAAGVLTKGWKAKANKGLVQEIIEEMERFNDITINKVNGHAGIEGNERADHLARDAVKRHC